MSKVGELCSVCGRWKIIEAAHGFGRCGNTTQLLVDDPHAPVSDEKLAAVEAYFKVLAPWELHDDPDIFDVNLF